MLLEVVSIFDKQLGAYSQPSFVASKGVALRSFTDQVNSSSSPMHLHPEDYSLFRIAQFDDVSGEFIPLSSDGLCVELIINAIDCVSKQ